MRRWVARLALCLVPGLLTLALPGLPAHAQEAQEPPRVTLVLNSGADSFFGTHELAWFRGRAPAGERVRFYRVTASGRTWVASATAGPKGVFSRMHIPRSGKYVAVSAGQTSAPLTVAWRQMRSLEERQAALSWLLGSPKTGIRADTDLRWRRYQRGWLVERAGRAHLVIGAAAAAYARRGGVTGDLRLPRRDPRCLLPEGGCSQLFDRGAIYTNPRARHSPVVQLGPSPRLAALVAVARSQVGYVEPAYRKGKFSVWMEATEPDDAWCGYFQAWVSWAAGEGEAILKRRHFSRMVAAERERGRLRPRPAVGYLAYIGRPGHVGIVMSKSKGYIWLVEGNVAHDGRAGYPRGIFVVKRPRSQVAFYAEPLLQ